MISKDKKYDGDGLWVRYKDAEQIIDDLMKERDALKDDNERLRKEVEGFMEGMPEPALIEAMAIEVGDSDHYEWIAAARWLRRIAENATK